MNEPAVVELRLYFTVRKGVGSVVQSGTLGIDGQAQIAEALSKAIDIRLPEGIVLTRSQIQIGDACTSYVDEPFDK